MGLALMMLERFADAYASLRQSLTILKNKLGNDHLEVADCLSSMGDCAMKVRLDQAIDLCFSFPSFNAASSFRFTSK